MLDFGFSEILLTSAIALVVLGPERLPKVARQVGNWMGRARAMARQLSEQLEREVSADELLKLQTKKLEAPALNRIAPPQGSMSPASTGPHPVTEQATPPTGHPEYNPPLSTIETHTAHVEAPPAPHVDYHPIGADAFQVSPASVQAIPQQVPPLPSGHPDYAPPIEAGGIGAAHDLHTTTPEASSTPHVERRNASNE